MIDFDNLLDNQYFFINLLDNLMNLTLRQLNAFLVELAWRKKNKRNLH